MRKTLIKTIESLQETDGKKQRFGIGNCMELSSLRMSKTLIENFGEITLFFITITIPVN